MKINRRTFVSGLAALATAELVVVPGAGASPGNDIELTARPHQMPLVGAGGPPSSLWGYNGMTPGPELRLIRGEEFRVRFRNELPEPTSIHWHGIRIDNAMDGVAGLTQAAVAPGDSFVYRFRAPDAGTYWYHAHNKSWNQVARGLYGPLIVDEPPTAQSELFELTLMLDDWRVDRSGIFDAASLGQMMDWSHGGRLGNVITVNGLARPAFGVPAKQHLRLRLINASNSRVMAIDPARIGAELIAYDGQSLANPEKPDDAPMLLGPAQRVDLLVRFEKPGEVWLEELSGEPFPMTKLNVADSQPNGSDELPKLIVPDIPAPDIATGRAIDLVMEGGAMGQIGALIYNGRVQEPQDFMQNGQVCGFNGVANLAEAPLFSARIG